MKWWENLCSLVEALGIGEEEEAALLLVVRRAWTQRSRPERPPGLSDTSWRVVEATLRQVEESFARRSRAGRANVMRRYASATNSTKPTNGSIGNFGSPPAESAAKSTGSTIGSIGNIGRPSDESAVISSTCASAPALAPENNTHITSIILEEPGRDLGRTLPRREQRTPRARARRVPADWQPDEGHRRIALERGVDFGRELESFRDHEFAVPKSDWSAAFRNWLRRARSQMHRVDRQVMRHLSGEAPTASVWDMLDGHHDA